MALRWYSHDKQSFWIRPNYILPLSPTLCFCMWAGTACMWRRLNKISPVINILRRFERARVFCEYILSEAGFLVVAGTHFSDCSYGTSNRWRSRLGQQRPTRWTCARLRASLTRTATTTSMCCWNKAAGSSPAAPTPIPRSARGERLV